MTKPKPHEAANKVHEEPTVRMQATTTWSSVLDMPIAELTSRVAKANALMTEILELFPGLVSLTTDERQTSNGRLREGEGQMFLVIVSIIEKFPAFFEGLADLDNGVDPTKVETDLLRDRIQRAELLAPLGTLADGLGGLSDSVLYLRGLVRDPIKEAYGIAKSQARSNQPLRSLLAPVLNFYSAMAKAAAASRKAKAQTTK